MKSQTAWCVILAIILTFLCLKSTRESFEEDQEELERQRARMAQAAAT